MYYWFGGAAWELRNRLAPIGLIVLAAFSIPLLGMIPPSVYFRTDDFQWLTWAAAHGPAGAFTTTPQKIPFGHYRPVCELFWILGHDIFGTSSAVPWLLSIALVFAAGHIIICLWGNWLDSPYRRAGTIACCLWFLAFLPSTYFLLNVYNVGKVIVFLFLPLTIWGFVAFYERPGRPEWLAVAVLAGLVSVLTRESTAVIIPAVVAAYSVADRLGTKKSMPAWTVVALPWLPLAGAAALLLLSPPMARNAAKGLDAAMAAMVSENVKYLLGVLFGNRHLAYLWCAVGLLATIRRRHGAIQGLVLGAVVVSVLSRPLAPYAVVLAVAASCIPGRPKITVALLVWFLLAFAGPVLTKRPGESYLLEASIPLVLLTGLALSVPVGLVADRLRDTLRRTLPRVSVRVAFAGLVIVLIGAGAAIAGSRVYTRELLPYKVHGQQFREANEFLLARVPPGGIVYVVDNRTAYRKGMEDYMRKYRRFAVTRPDCWFSAFGRPDVRVLPWKPGGGACPAFLFASNDYEKRYCAEQDPRLPSHTVFDNPACAVYDLGALE